MADPSDSDRRFTGANTAGKHDQRFSLAVDLVVKVQAIDWGEA